MKHFSQDTIKHAEAVFAVKEELKSFIIDGQFDEIDLYKIADEFTNSYLYEGNIDEHRNPAMRRDYRNYDLDLAFKSKQHEILRHESAFLGDDDPVDGLNFSAGLLGLIPNGNGAHYV